MIWADGCDILEGEHEADTGLIATCATKEQAQTIAAMLERGRTLQEALDRAVNASAKALKRADAYKDKL